MSLGGDWRVQARRAQVVSVAHKFSNVVSHCFVSKMNWCYQVSLDSLLCSSRAKTSTLPYRPSFHLFSSSPSSSFHIPISHHTNYYLWTVRWRDHQTHPPKTLVNLGDIRQRSPPSGQTPKQPRGGFHIMQIIVIIIKVSWFECASQLH